MDHLEQSLRAALRREEPPEGFAERVIARAELAGQARERLNHKHREEGAGAWWRALWSGKQWFAAPALRVALASVMLLMVITGGLALREQRQQRVEGERAREQALLALRIAGGELRAVQAKLERFGESQQME
jgi:hypothetical protein